MDQEKLSGLADAIEAESKIPSPSHNNLARLVTMALREIIRVEQTIVHLPEAVSTTLHHEKPKRARKKK